jgi:hypothetical protein
MKLWAGLFLGLALAACSAPVSVVETAVGETQSIWTEVPSQTPYPTYTPLPTHTPRPTYTALPIPPTVVVTRKVTQIVTRLVTATAPPQFVEMYRFTGSGKESTDLFVLPSGKVKITWKYTGSNNFAFYLTRLDNDAKVMLENAIGSTEGQQILNVGASDEYLFDMLFASGDWEIVVEYRP